MNKRNFIRFGIIFLVPLSFIISQCIHETKPAVIFNDPRGNAYAGSATCITCHKKVSEDYIHTAHFQTSRLATQASVLGSFAPGSNVVKYNDSISVIMEKHNDGLLYQASYVNGKLREAQPFNIVFGFKRAETFLYWKDSYVYQLPVTYYTQLHEWANSPGYSDKRPYYTRMIGEACFECHSSNIKQIPPTQEQIIKKTIGLASNTMMLSIDCERCHGPAAQHVNFHLENPKEKQPMYITKISGLSRAQRSDLCGVCHSGINQVAWSTFDFKPGDTLTKYFDGRFLNQAPDVTQIDVHGNQIGLLKGSKCYIQGKIECGTCHGMHDNGVKTVKMYSQICQSCHSNASHNVCKMTGQIGQPIAGNCLDCHMPIRSSHSIVIHGAATQNDFYQARMHRIAIYPEETKKVMAMLNGAKVD
jgi:hypothetical protein